jgi:hypothetical protein
MVHKLWPSNSRGLHHLFQWKYFLNNEECPLVDWGRRSSPKWYPYNNFSSSRSRKMSPTRTYVHKEKSRQFDYDFHISMPSLGNLKALKK